MTFPKPKPPELFASVPTGPGEAGKLHLQFGPVLTRVALRPRGPAFRNSVLSTLALALMILWLLGVVTSLTLDGLIHVLLALAIVSGLAGS